MIKVASHCIIRCLSIFTKTLCTLCTMSMIHWTVSTMALTKAFHILHNVDGSLHNVDHRSLLLSGEGVPYTLSEIAHSLLYHSTQDTRQRSLVRATHVISDALRGVQLFKQYRSCFRAGTSTGIVTTPKSSKKSTIEIMLVSYV